MCIGGKLTVEKLHAIYWDYYKTHGYCSKLPTTFWTNLPHRKPTFPKKEQNDMDFVEKANSIDYVKDLLNMKKELAILRLFDLIPYINKYSNNSELRITYLKILPVFLSYSELHNVHTITSFSIIKMIRLHPLFSRYKSLLDAWYLRFHSLTQEKPIPLAILKKACENSFRHIPGTELNDIIGYSELDLFMKFHKWMKYHKLHKYLYFFANLSYTEIANVTAENIQTYEKKVNIFPMTNGARNAIVRKLIELRDRPEHLRKFCKEENVNTRTKMESAIEVIKGFLKTPIRGNNGLSQDEVLPKLFSMAIKNISLMAMNKFEHADTVRISESLLSLLKMAWSCQFFTTKQKQSFNKYQQLLNEKLKSKPKKPKMRMEKAMKEKYCVKPEDHLVDLGIQSITIQLEKLIADDF